MEIPFLGGAYEGRSKSINAQQSINMFPVFDRQEAKTIIAMYGTPGTDDFCNTGTSAVVRRMHVMKDHLYAVVGAVVYEIDTAGVATSLGEITTSTGHVGMADNGEQLLICDGTEDGFIVTTGTLTNIKDGVSWILGESAADNNWTGVAYGNGVFVAVADTGVGNRAMVSSDGYNWTIGKSPSLLVTTMAVAGEALDMTINTYYPDRFADGDVIGVTLDSEDIHWTTVNGTPTATTITLASALTGAVAVDNEILTTIDNEWNSVAYGGGTFVAVANTGTGNRVMTSSDGVTWTIRTSAADNNWISVTYGSSLFVAVANNEPSPAGDLLVMTSPTGVTWTIRQTPVNTWRAVTYGNNLFVAVADSGTGDRVMTSSDGITWTTRTSAADNDWAGITYGNSLFVAVAASGTGNRVMTSPDGITWTIRTSAVDNEWQAVAYAEEKFVAVANIGTSDRIMISEDGITWEAKTSPNTNAWVSVTYGGDSFVAVSGNGVGDRVMLSPGEGYQFPAGVDCVFFDGYFIITILDTGKIQISKLYDGYSWNALDFATAEASPDNLVGVGTTRQNIWLFGEFSTEVYYNSGNADFPFQRVPGAILDIGCGSLTSVAEIEGVLYWLTNKKTIVMNLGYSFETISTEAINYQLSTYSTIADAIGYSYSLEGRTFYVITFPTADKTWVVNIKDRQWHEWRSLS